MLFKKRFFNSITSFTVMTVLLCSLHVYAEDESLDDQSADTDVIGEMIENPVAELEASEELNFNVVTEPNGSVTLDWSSYTNPDVSYYKIFRNDEEAKTVADTDNHSFNDKSKVDVINTYKISAYTSDDSLIAESASKACPLYSINYKKSLQLFKSQLKNDGDSKKRYVSSVQGNSLWKSATSDTVTLLDGVSLGAKNVQDTTGWTGSCHIYDEIDSYDLTDMYDDCYVKFLLYIKSESDIIGKLSMNLRTNKGGALSSRAIPVNSVNEWQIVSMKLSDMAWASNSPDRMKQVRGLTFTFKGAESDVVDFYVQDISIWKNKDFSIQSCDEDDGYVNLVWSDDSSDAVNYEIIRNGESIDFCSDKVYTDKSVEKDTIYSYTIRSYDENGDMLDETLPMSVPVYDNDLMRVVQFFRNSKRLSGDTTDRYSVSASYTSDSKKFVPIKNGTNTLIGGLSLGASNCIDETGYTGNIHIEDTITKHDLSNYYKTGYLKFLLYIASDDISEISGNLHVALRTPKGVAVGKCKIAEKLTNSWRIVTVKLTDMTWNNSNSEGRIKIVNGISLFYAGSEPVDVYVQDICIYDTAVRSSLSFDSACIDDETTMFNVNVNIDGNLDENTLNADLFKLQNTTCSSVEYDKESGKMKLFFDIVPKFPESYILEYDGHSIKNENNLGIIGNELEVQTLPFQNCIKILNDKISFNKDENGITDLSVPVKGLYTADTNDFNMYLVIYDGNVIKQVISQTIKVMTNAENRFDYSGIDLSDMVASGSLRAEAYFVDSHTLKPVAPYVDINLE